jgi:hypothetical protein
MTPTLGGLAQLLLTNFVTVHLPRCETLWRALDHDLRPQAHLRCLGHVLRAENLVVGYHRLAIRNGLWTHGHNCFLDRAELVGKSGWRIHLFVLDPGITGLLPQITQGTVGPGDPVNFDPKRFVTWRLQQMEMLYWRTGRYEWQDDNVP